MSLTEYFLVFREFVQPSLQFITGKLFRAIGRWLGWCGSLAGSALNLRYPLLAVDRSSATPLGRAVESMIAGDDHQRAGR